MRAREACRSEQSLLSPHWEEIVVQGLQVSVYDVVSCYYYGRMEVQSVGVLLSGQQSVKHSWM